MGAAPMGSGARAMANETVNIRLTDEQIESLHEVARLAGVRKETVVKVLLAMFVIKHPECVKGDEDGSR